MTKNLTNCPICGFHKFEKYPSNSLSHNEFFRCERCGEFEASGNFLAGFQDVKRKISEVGYILSGLARELYETDQEMPVFMIKNIDETLKHPLVPDVTSIEEKIQKFLQHLRKKTEYFGQEIDLGNIETVVPLAYAKIAKN